MTADQLTPIVAQGRNCWRIARADQASVIVDAADYYRIIAAAMEAAQKRIFIVGWDFDTRIALVPDEHGQGETLGRFFLRLAKDKPERQIDILKWNFGALKQFFRPAAVVWLARWWRTKAIDFRFDSSHPAGLQPPPEDRRHRRQPRGLRRDRHFDRALGHARPSRRRSAPHRPRRQALSAVARRDDADARRRRRRARRAWPRAVEGRDARRARADRAVRRRLAGRARADVPRRRHRHRPDPRRL